MMNLTAHRVAWTDGILLGPQHFQQLERYIEQLLDARLRALQHCGWGLSGLKLDASLLQQGRVALSSASGVFPDGTPFSLPDSGSLPLPFEADADCVGEIICLALPLDVLGSFIVDLTDTANSARFRATVADVPDRNYGNVGQSESAPIVTMQLGRLHTRLARKESISSGETALPIGRISGRTPDGALRMDEIFLPPLLNLHGYGWLNDTAKELLGLLQQRLITLSRPNISSSGTGGVSELLELLLLQTMAEYRLQLLHILHKHPASPEALFRILLSLLGRLAAVPGGGQFVMASYPYEHADLAGSFMPLIDALRHALSLVIEAPAVALNFRDRGDHIQVCVNDPLLRLEKIIFVVSANLPGDRLKTYFPAQAKFGPVEKIVQLIDLQLPGARMLATHSAPRHVPYYPNSIYFEVDSKDPLWSATMEGAGMALSVVGDFPDLRIEVWGLRQGRIG